MLISNQKYSVNDVATFKLLNGDEVVAKIIEDNADHWVISKPCTVLPSPKGMGLVQSLYTSTLETNVFLSKSHVMMHGPSVLQIKDYYIETTTGINLTSSSVIV